MTLFKFNDDSLLVSVDIGSYAIRCAVFRRGERFPLDLLAFTEKKTAGLEESRILNSNDFSLRLSEILNSAEELCNSSFSSLWVGFSPPFHSFRSQGMLALINREVNQEDVDLCIKTACAVPFPDGHMGLHSTPESFCVDGQTDVFNPLGLSGLRLETDVRLVTVPQFYPKDIIKVLKNLGYKPRAFFHNLVAFSQSFLSPQAKKEGICFCDIGYKSTKAIVYHKGKTAKMFTIPLGGYHFSTALCSQFNISLEMAEHLKETKGQLLFSSYDKEDPPITAKKDLYLSRKLFIQTLEKTAEELLEQIKHTLTSNQLIKCLSSGFMFSGGTAYIKGFLEFASFSLGKPVAHPQKIYEDFKTANNLALIQQAYLENQGITPKHSASSRWSVLRELF